MDKTFNLKKFRKHAFYEGARGYFQGETKAKQICYKCKYDDGRSPQQAWKECAEEYNEAGDKGDWVLKYSNVPDGKKSAERLTSKTPAVQEMGFDKEK
jgi:hypothetical protein